MDCGVTFGGFVDRDLRFLREGGVHVSVKKHSELIDVANKILSDSTKEEIRAALLGTDAAPSHINCVETTIELCAGLLAMVEVGVHKYGFSGSNPLSWYDKHSLREAIKQFFQPGQHLKPDNQKLERLFTAHNLSSIGGMRIKWTTNLVDHLMLTDDDQTVFIFHCVGFLEFHQSFADALFPDGFMEETLRTLALLFPQNNSKSRRWIQAQIASGRQIDTSLARCGSLRAHERRFSNFHVWHDRLVVLKQAFDDSSPRTLTQWWNDRRNSVQWYTFWHTGRDMIY
ncbi:hypothetical protein HRG_002186 [Hirsutella rhossiliensis]|uniref:Uncharacterized protein n=1 Tax=Hirsutella rhossiliensis TaxID=111463 RepID=A0A9P8N8W4_9HYPO|nr:uncharacterized protein HRG_02186 [Hirsutella rhossiliensis]KAH0966777.1 hypothetical protein HRG_02186 [Hirsutella rhossiliensis]